MEAGQSRAGKACQGYSAEGELLASRQLLEAANTLSQNPAAMQMRYLQTLTEIAVEKNSTIVFPLPIELMKVFEKLGNKP